MKTIDPVATSSTEYRLYKVDGRYHLYRDGLVCFEADSTEDLQRQLEMFHQQQAANLAMWLVEDLFEKVEA